MTRILGNCNQFHYFSLFCSRNFILFYGTWQNYGTVRTTMLGIERFYLFIILSLQIYLLYVCSFTMWRGGAQVIKEVRGCGGAKWTDFPTTILGFLYQRRCKRGHHKILPRITILSVVILNIPILRNIRAVAYDLKRHSHHSAQAKVKCLIIMWIVGMDHYLAMIKNCLDQPNKVERE